MEFGNLGDHCEFQGCKQLGTNNVIILFVISRLRNYQYLIVAISLLTYLCCTNSLLISKDFLPFGCRGCNKTFCLEHRSFAAHKCENVDSGVPYLSVSSLPKVVVPVCPLCSQPLSIKKGEDINRRVNCELNFKSDEERSMSTFPRDVQKKNQKN
jgi:hypothetical protein